jgi:hypothetical protein
VKKFKKKEGLTNYKDYVFNINRQLGIHGFNLDLSKYLFLNSNNSKRVTIIIDVFKVRETLLTLS